MNQCFWKNRFNERFSESYPPTGVKIAVNQQKGSIKGLKVACSYSMKISPFALSLKSHSHFCSFKPGYSRHPSVIFILGELYLFSHDQWEESDCDSTSAQSFASTNFKSIIRSTCPTLSHFLSNYAFKCLMSPGRPSTPPSSLVSTSFILQINQCVTNATYSVTRWPLCHPYDELK